LGDGVQNQGEPETSRVSSQFTPKAVIAAASTSTDGAAPIRPCRPLAAGQEFGHDFSEVVLCQARHDRITGVEFLDHPPLRSGRSCQRHLDPPDALAGDVGKMLGMVQQSQCVERSAEHQHLAAGGDELGERRALAIAVVERVIAGEPLRLRSERDDRGAGIAAAQRARRRAQELRQHAIVADRARALRIEGRDVFAPFRRHTPVLVDQVLVARFPIGIGKDGALGTDGVAQGCDDGIRGRRASGRPC
jgi:hypothetical protein